MSKFNDFETAEKIGLDIVEALLIKPLKRRDSRGLVLYETIHGVKTAAGLARTVENIIKNR